MATWYCIAALRHLGEPGSIPMSSSTACRAAGVPHNFTRNALLQLMCARVVTSTGGKSGGYVLARRRCDISLAEVVEAIDGPLASPPDEALEFLTPSSGRLLNSVAAGCAADAKRRLAR